MKLSGFAFLCLIFVLSSNVEAQLVRSAGIKAGAIAANQDWNYAPEIGGFDAKTRWGYDAGGFVEWLNIPFFSVSRPFHAMESLDRESTSW